MARTSGLAETGYISILYHCHVDRMDPLSLDQSKSDPCSNLNIKYKQWYISEVSGEHSTDRLKTLNCLRECVGSWIFFLSDLFWYQLKIAEGKMSQPCFYKMYQTRMVRDSNRNTRIYFLFASIHNLKEFCSNEFCTTVDRL